MSNQFILKYVPANEAPQGVADPQLLLDYRCYIGMPASIVCSRQVTPYHRLLCNVAGGADALGTDYPPQVKQCLRQISSMTIQEVGLQLKVSQPDPQRRCAFPQVQAHYQLPDELPARNLHSRATGPAVTCMLRGCLDDTYSPAWFWHRYDYQGI